MSSRVFPSRRELGSVHENLLRLDVEDGDFNKIKSDTRHFVKSKIPDKEKRVNLSLDQMDDLIDNYITSLQNRFYSSIRPKRWLQHLIMKRNEDSELFNTCIANVILGQRLNESRNKDQESSINDFKPDGDDHEDDSDGDYTDPSPKPRGPPHSARDGKGRFVPEQADRPSQAYRRPYFEDSPEPSESTPVVPIREQSTGNTQGVTPDRDATIIAASALQHPILTDRSLPDAALSRPSQSPARINHQNPTECTEKNEDEGQRQSKKRSLEPQPAHGINPPKRIALGSPAVQIQPQEPAHVIEDQKINTVAIYGRTFEPSQAAKFVTAVFESLTDWCGDMMRRSIDLKLPVERRKIIGGFSRVLAEKIEEFDQLSASFVVKDSKPGCQDTVAVYGHEFEPTEAAKFTTAVFEALTDWCGGLMRSTIDLKLLVEERKRNRDFAAIVVGKIEEFEGMAATLCVKDTISQ